MSAAPRVVELAAVAVFALTSAMSGCDGDDGDEGTDAAIEVTEVPDASLAPIDPVASTTLPAPAALEELSAGLLGAGDVGVPGTWAIRDLDPAVMDEATVQEADPFQGLVTCPAGALRDSAAWLQRTFAAPEDPLETGLLSVDIIVEREDEAAAEAGMNALTGCTPVGPDTAVEVGSPEVVPTDGSGAAVGPGVAATEVTVTSGPSADVPYPSATTAVTAHRNGRTVVLVLGGLDLGVPWSDSARDLVGRLLGRFN
jgi:hypothetical protein